MESKKRCPKIVLTGGPGGGKTVAADLFRRELGEKVVVVPESATLLFKGGFPRSNNEDVIKATQRAIYHVQKNLEDIQSICFDHRILICDRGTLDGLAYWPNSAKTFCAEMGTTIEKEFERYDGVVFFESAAVGDISIEGGNPTRIESLSAARRIDQSLREVWHKHPNFRFVPHSASFVDKVVTGLAVLRNMLEGL
ncbi:MAG: ATP-binding protein [Bdellovibrionales bacterium]